MSIEKKPTPINILIMALVVVNLLLSVYVTFFKHDALWLETLKAGWATNMSMAKQLYESPVYIQQQKSTLDQILGSMNQAAPQPTVTPTLPSETQPTVTQ